MIEIILLVVVLAVEIVATIWLASLASPWPGLLKQSMKQFDELLTTMQTQRGRFELAAEAERAKLLADFAKERDAWAAERKELLDRIQAWVPPPAETAKEEGPSQQEVNEKDEHGGWTAEELAHMSLKPNSGGGYLDMLNGGVWETVGECMEYRAILKKRGLPLTTHPDEVT
jgi:hypothetical protein